jgi:hypothetical protein
MGSRVTTLSRLRSVWVIAILLAAGCGGSATPVAPVTATPLPTATPAPAPTPVPTPTPDVCTQGLCEEPVSNRNKAVRLTLRLYSVTDGQGNRLNLTVDDDLPIGSILIIDATAKDADGQDTLGRNAIQWYFVNESLGHVGGQHSHQKRVIVKAPGNMFVTATVDGVTSNELSLRFR